MAGVYRQSLNSLQENAVNTLIVGVVINSLNPRALPEVAQYATRSRAVWTFTLRDSVHDTINVTVWGSENYIKRLIATFQIETVIEVINAKVALRKVEDRNENFCPNVTSCYSLTVNESSALIQEYSGPDKAQYQALIKLPTKNPSSMATLASIMENIDCKTGQFYNVVVIVTFIGESRNIITKDGRALVTRDFEVTDGSYDDTVAFKLWENSWVNRSGLWVPKTTVLLLADAQVIFNAFKKKTELSITRKTLITEDPNMPQTSAIRETIKTDSEYMPHDPFITPKPESITNVMTIHEISERLNKQGVNNGRVQFMAIVYAEVTDMNLSSDTPVIYSRCALCKRFVQNAEDSCMNLECPCGNGRRVPENVASFYIKLNLKDKTGYLIACRLTGVVAERVLGCTATEFEAMSIEERDAIKQSFQSVQFDVRLQIVGPSSAFPRAVYNILSMTRLDQYFTDE